MRNHNEVRQEKAPKFDPQAARDLETRKNPTQHAFSRSNDKEGKNECHYCGRARLEHQEEVDCSTGIRLIKKVR